MDTRAFTQLILEKGSELYRDMPWRKDTQPYYILVSELMLQQTQVPRVVPKFTAFIEAFPTVEVLANAPLSDVLIQWSGLGYNRRAKFLHQSAQKIVGHHSGNVPSEYNELLGLSGVGPNTAGAIMAYAYNQPAIFIETNIRTVYIHHFFSDSSEVDDAHIRQKLFETLPSRQARRFYWALMDYGTHLKATGVRNNKKSRHYKKQSPLEGSVRQVRGDLLRQLSYGELHFDRLMAKYRTDARFPIALQSLKQEGFVEQEGQIVRLTK